MKVSHRRCLLTLEKDPNTQENVSMYIRELRSTLRDLLLENTILRKEATLPDLNQKCNFNYNPLPPNHFYFQKELDDYLFLTITYDPRKFPQLIVSNSEDQKRYIEQVIALAITNQVITLFYGVYELQKNGNIHVHIILNKYSSEENIETIKSFFTPYFTDRKNNTYAIDCKAVTNIEGLIKDYLIKAPEGVVHNLPIDIKKSISLDL